MADASGASVDTPVAASDASGPPDDPTAAGSSVADADAKLAKWQSQVKPHKDLEELIPGTLWAVEGTLPFPLPRNMYVYRKPGAKGLLLWSVVALGDSGMAALDALGEVEVIVVPNHFHRMDCAVYKERYPQAKVVCSADHRAKVSDVVPVDSTYEELFTPGNPHGVSALLPIQGGRFFTETELALEVSGGVAVLFCDACFNVVAAPPGLSWFSRTLMNTATVGPFGPTRVLGRVMLRSAEFGRWLGGLPEALGGQTIQALGVGHGTTIVGSEACAEAIAAAAKRLTG